MSTSTNTNYLDMAFKFAAVFFAASLWNVVAPTTAFFWTVFLVWWVFRLDSRIIGGVALAFLTSIPILLSLQMDVKAEQFAVYVYFLLAMTVVLQILEFRREKPREIWQGSTEENISTPNLPIEEPRTWKKIPILKKGGVVHTVHWVGDEIRARAKTRPKSN